jgi:DNA-directed RNA polymerase alpha subunit
MTYDLIMKGNDDRLDSDYDKTQLENGVKVEMEHTDNKEIAKKIAKDHLDEFPDYYVELAKMEEKLKGEMEDPSPDDMAKLID